MANAGSELRRTFAAHYGHEAGLYRAPGRVNLIGEHTDYNDGWVMPLAIEMSCWAGMAARTDRRVRLGSSQYGDAAEFSLDDATATAGHWSAMLAGVLAILAREYGLAQGADIWLDSEVPIGAGLSSSAAAQAAVALAAVSEAGLAIGRAELAQICQRASHEFAGIRCGIMDQYIALTGRAGMVLMLDTRSLGEQWLPWPEKECLLVCDTGVKHDNASGEYNRRRAECEAAVRALAARVPGLRSLRDVSPELLARHEGALGPVLLRRARHVVSENARVEAAATALEAQDMNRFGELMRASHASLRDDYEVSCSELDRLQEFCAAQPGVYGARMMGGGFGGCVLAVLRRERAAAVQAAVQGLAARSWICQPAQGAEAVAA